MLNMEALAAISGKSLPRWTLAQSPTARKTQFNNFSKLSNAHVQRLDWLERLCDREDAHKMLCTPLSASGKSSLLHVVAESGDETLLMIALSSIAPARSGQTKYAQKVRLLCIAYHTAYSKDNITSISALCLLRLTRSSTTRTYH